jgi:hypothetical protein
MKPDGWVRTLAKRHGPASVLNDSALIGTAC